MLWTRGTDAGATCDCDCDCDCDAAVEERSTKTAMPFMYRTVVWAYDRISALFHRHACLPAETWPGGIDRRRPWRMEFQFLQ
jgi:hypothetical protein